jgi:hypothetical protein
LQILQNPVRLQDDIGAWLQLGLQAGQQKRKVALWRRSIEGNCGQQCALRSGRQVARRITPIPRRNLFPEMFSPAMQVVGDLDRRPAELGQGADQAADQRGLPHAPSASAYDDDRHRRYSLFPVS